MGKYNQKWWWDVGKVGIYPHLDCRGAIETVGGGLYGWICLGLFKDDPPGFPDWTLICKYILNSGFQIRFDKVLVGLDKGKKMFFNDDDSKKMNTYGIGTTTANGRFHLLASSEGGGRVRMLCQSCPKKLNGHSGSAPRWFSDEANAVRALRVHKKACQKCLRSIETTEMSQ